MKSDQTRDIKKTETPVGKQKRDVKEEPSEAAIDEAVEESFPASDPISVSITKKK